MRKIFTVLFFIVFHNLLCSQSTHHFTNLNRQDGLSNNLVRMIYQDDYGYMWFGTRGGLNRFDGKNIDTYKSNSKDLTALNGNYINDILFTSTKKLLVANGSGLNEFNYKRENFSQIKQLNSISVSIVVEDKQKNIWIVTSNNLVLKFDKDLNKIIDFSFTELIKNKFDTTSANLRVFKYDDENLIVNVSGKGFYLFNFISHEFKLKTSHVFNERLSMVKILKVDESEFWLATLSGIFVFRNNELIHYFKRGNSNKDLNSQFVQDLQRMNSDEIWIFTDGGGINVYNLKTKQFSYIKQNARDEFSLSSNFLYSSYVTKKGDLWIGSVKNGVDQLIEDNAFVTYKLRGFKDGIRSDYPASSMFIDSQDRIWIGSDGNGLYKFDKGQMEHVYSDEQVKTIPSINEYYHNYLLLGTYKKGVHGFNISNNKVINQSLLHQSIDLTDRVSNIFKDVNQNIFVNSSKTLIIDKIDQNPNKLLKPNKISFANDLLCSYVDEKSGTTFVGSRKGLYELNNNELQIVTDTPKRVISIIHYKGDLYWLATNKGVCLLNVKTKNTTFYTVESGLNLNSINSMVQSNSGDLWIGNILGVSKFDVKTRKFTNYTYRNGFLDNEFINPAAVKAKDGRLFFGGLKGVLAFYPDKIKEEAKPKEVIFTKLLINHKNEREYKAQDSDKYIAEADYLTLGHTEKVITIHYSTFEYDYPDNIEFSYILQGYDKEWRTTNNRSITYMNLNHGSYTLKIKASTTTGKYAESFSSIKIEVLPAWWETIWFSILVTVAILALIFFGVNFIFKRKQYKINVEFERKSLEDQKTLDENQLRFFTNLSHEIRTPLSLIISPIRTIINEETFNPKNIKNLNLIEKNAQRIEKLINRGIDFRRTQFKEPELQAQKIDIVLFLGDLVEGFQGISSVNEIELNFKSHITERIIWMDLHMVETIFYNLMSNAIKYSGKNGVVNFTISEDKENVIITVEDFGVGITKGDSEHIFERFFQSKDHIGGSGIGLALTKRFVEAHLGTISVESEKGKGSRFKVVLPFGNDQNYKEFLGTYNKVKVVKSQNVQFDESNKKENHLFKNKSLLIVEDEDNLRDYLEVNLGYEYNVVAVENGKLALDLIQNQAFDMVISDITMPVMDGLELCKQLKGNHKTNSIPVILLSARTMDKDKMKGYDVGADAYVEKPFQLELLKSQIGNLLESQVRRKNELLELLGVSKDSSTVSNSDEKFYAQVIAIIEKNIGNYDFDIPLFALEIGMSKSLLYKRIKAVSSVSINDLILSVRLKKAAQLLIHSRESIVEVSNIVGFKNAKYFSTSFKKKFNETPSNYRRSKTKSKARLS